MLKTALEDSKTLVANEESKKEENKSSSTSQRLASKIMSKMI